MQEPNIAELAVAAWRLEKWLDNLVAERKMAAKSSLRVIKKYLTEKEIEIVDLTGSRFDVGLAVSVVNNESEEKDEEKLLISEMVKPIIKEKGAVIQYGQVILGDEVKKPKSNSTAEESKVQTAEKTVEALAVEIQTAVEAKKEAEELKQQNVEEKAGVQSGAVREKRRSKIGAWLVMFGLQITMICLLVKTMGQLQVIQNQGATVATESGERFDSAEAGLSALNGKVDTMEQGLSKTEKTLDFILVQLQGMEAKEEENDKAQEQEEAYTLYLVQAGDSLLNICKKQGVDYYSKINEILEINGIEDPNQIFIGQAIKLPK